MFWVFGGCWLGVVGLVDLWCLVVVFVDGWRGWVYWLVWIWVYLWWGGGLLFAGDDGLGLWCWGFGSLRLLVGVLY